jgi:hypothetical protein
MSPLNVFVEKSKFTLEGWDVMFDYCKEQQYAVKFDLKKYYHEIDINKDFRTYFGFMYIMDDNADPQTFVWNTMPYGYTQAPFIARSLMKPLIGKWRKLGMKVVVFYNDGMAVDSDFEKLNNDAGIMHSDLVNAGLIPGVGKCIWTPVSKVDWNGLHFDFDSGGISILKHRVDKTLNNIEAIVSDWPNVTFRQVARLVGQIISMNPVFNGTEQLRSRMLQTFINIRHYKNKSWEAPIQAGYEPLFQLALTELKKLKFMIENNNFRPFREASPGAIAWVDASEVALAALAAKVEKLPESPVTVDNWLLDSTGAYRRLKNCANLQIALPRLTQPNVIVRDMFDLDPVHVKKCYLVHRNLEYWERAVDSNERELLAAVQLLRSCGGHLANEVLTLKFDNANAAIICGKGSPKPRLQKYAEQIADIALAFNIKIKGTWVPRDLNNVADCISKVIDYEDYSLKDSVFKEICDELGSEPIIDCFANDKNAKTELFYSLTYCPNTAGIDCFAYNWKLAGLCWLFPPPRLIGKTIKHLEACKGEAFLLVPQWRNAYFYPMLVTMDQKVIKRKLIFDGANIFNHGIDNTSYFGPDYKGYVECYWLKF